MENCKKAVDEHADLFVLIVGGRYGSETPAGKSVTNIEYLQARAKGIPVNVFVHRTIRDVMALWKANPNADFSSVADSPKLFEFVDSLYRSGDVWVHSFDYAEDIISTLRKQWAYLIKDALDVRWKMNGCSVPDKVRDLPASALRFFIERPSLWEAHFFSELFSWYVSSSRDIRQDLERGIVVGRIRSLSPGEALDWLHDKIRSHFRNCNTLSTLINTELGRAFGPPGQPADVEALDYIARRVGEIYRAEIENASELDRVVLEKDFEDLVRLVKASCLDLIQPIEEGQEKLRQDLTRLEGSLSADTYISLGSIGAKAPYTALTDEYTKLAKKFDWSPRAL